MKKLKIQMILIIIIAFISGMFTLAIIESEFNKDLFDVMTLCFEENYELRNENKDLSEELMLLKYPQLSNESFWKEYLERNKMTYYNLSGDWVYVNQDLCMGIYDCAVQKRGSEK